MGDTEVGKNDQGHKVMVYLRVDSVVIAILSVFPGFSAWSVSPHLLLKSLFLFILSIHLSPCSTPLVFQPLSPLSTPLHVSLYLCVPDIPDPWIHIKL